MKRGLGNVTIWCAQHVQTQLLCYLFGAAPRCWAVMLALYGAHESRCLHRTVETSKSIVAGASEADVLRVLGKPTIRAEKRGELAAAFFGKVPEKWIYGTTIDLHHFFAPDLPIPNPIPIRFRLWETPDDMDLVVEWKDDHTVARVTRP